MYSVTDFLNAFQHWNISQTERFACAIAGFRKLEAPPHRVVVGILN